MNALQQQYTKKIEKLQDEIKETAVRLIFQRLDTDSDYWISVNLKYLILKNGLIADIVTEEACRIAIRQCIEKKVTDEKLETFSGFHYFTEWDYDFAKGICKLKYNKAVESYIQKLIEKKQAEKRGF